MTRKQQQPPRPLFLGIEGGGTHAVAILADTQGQLIKRWAGGPANLRLLSDAQLRALFKSIAAAFPPPDALGIGMAGARTEADLARIRAAAARVWRGLPCQATDDLETALAAAEAIPGKHTAARVLVLSGTGSCCFGRNAAGKSAKVGGWGHLLGDRGSAYQIALLALKQTFFIFDRTGNWPTLGVHFLRRLQLNEPTELIGWAQAADKSEIASLAVEVFAAQRRGDILVRDIIESAEMALASDAFGCAQRLARRGASVHFILAGGVLLKQPRFARAVEKKILQSWPRAVVTRLTRESAWGAVSLAEKIWRASQLPGQPAKPSRKSKTAPDSSHFEIPLVQAGRLSPTEQRNPRSKDFDRLTISAAVELMLAEDAKIPAALLAERWKIARAVELITRAFKRGGRLFYVGAGTSGRLGVLDASECPPTFRTPPEMVQGIIAGGQGSLWRSVEGAEDDPLAGARAVEFRRVTRRDVVVGIAASGRTPFVWGALDEAKKRGAVTILLGFNPWLKIPRAARPTLAITPDVGPEILTGSTRLKAGTATKLILNIFTTVAMARLGKVIGNLMVDLNPSNAKLRDRAVRIVQELCGVDPGAAEQALKQSGWVIKRACARLKI